MIELHAIIRGHVQGVCFRATAQGHAERLMLCGTVRNCSDGSVELVVQGERQLLEDLLESLKKEPGYGRVDSIETTYRPILTLLEGFRVIRG